MGRRTRELILTAAVCGGLFWALHKPAYHAFVLDPAMRRAVKYYDVQAVRRLALQGADVNVGPSAKEVNPFGTRLRFTPLHLAAKAGDVETLEVLIRKGANLEAQTDKGRTPLMDAALTLHVPAVEALLRAGAGVDIQDAEGATALILVVDDYTPSTKMESIAMVQTLLRHGADPHATPDDFTALARAEEKGATRLAKVLRKTGSAGMHACLDRIAGKGPLYAVRSDRVDAVKRLVRRNVSFRVRDNQGTTLTAAAWRGTGAMLPYLLQHTRGIDRAFLNERGDGGTALVLSALHHRWNYIRLLLKRGADPNLTDEAGSTALHFAVMRGQPAIVTLLLKAGADVHATDGVGDTPLSLAQHRRDKPMEILLRAAGATR